MTLIATVPMWCDIGLLTDCRIVPPDENLLAALDKPPELCVSPSPITAKRKPLKIAETTAGTTPGTMNEGLRNHHWQHTARAEDRLLIHYEVCVR